MSSRREELVELVKSWRQPPPDPEAFAAAIDDHCSLRDRLPPCPDATAGEWRASIEKFARALSVAREALPPSARTMLRQHMAMNDRRFMDSQPVDDILDAMMDAAVDLQDDAPPEYARARPELSLVGGVARICERHGVKVSSASGSRFLRVLGVILPGRDHRGLIRQAMDRGVISRPTG